MMRRTNDTKFRWVRVGFLGFWLFSALLGLAATCGVIYLLWQAGLYLAKLNAA